jgi:non-ribosomal peptide synthase protein (TIGR01720 family)
MQPAQIIILDKFPLTQNGKLDRKALPLPEGREGIGLYQAPEGPIEEKLASIWSELLSVDKVGRNDNFFSLGGDSIVSIQLVSRAKSQGIVLEVKQVFETPSIQGLAANCKAGDLPETIIPQGVMHGNVSLLPIQHWFFKQNLKEVNHYNQAMWFMPNSYLSSDDKAIFKQKLITIYNHHDTLRLRYKKSKESMLQYYDDIQFYFEEIKLDSWEDESLFNACTNIQQSLDIIHGPLSRVVWFESGNKQGLFWVIHHLLVDGVSWRILLEDLNTSYSGISLPSKTYSYQAFSNYLLDYADLSKTINYYQSKQHQYKSLRKSSKLEQIDSTRVEYVIISLSKKESQNFIQKAQSSYNTKANDLLLTALVLSMGKALGKYKVCIDLEGHGREGDLDVTRTIGWFTTSYPVYLEISDPDDLGTCIKEVKEQLRAIPEKGFIYGIAVMQGKLDAIDADLVFNYLGQWDAGKEQNKHFNFGYAEVGESSSPNNKPSHGLSINGGMQNNQLSFNLSYSAEYTKETAELLASDFQSNLSLLIKHCITKDNYGYTPSDFELVDLSVTDLSTIINKVDKAVS